MATYVLIKGADWLVEGASGIAFKFGLPKIIVGATIVSLGTTSPEAAVSVTAAWNGNAGLALGNAVGSVIADTGLIFGLGCILCVLPADRFVLKRQGWVQFGSAVLLAIACYVAFAMQGAEASLGRGVGVVCLVLLAGYMWISVKWSRQHAKLEALELEQNQAATITEKNANGSGGDSEADDDFEADLTDELLEESKKHTALFLGWLVFIGLVLVIVGSHVMVESAGQLALRIGIPEVVIAGTLVAFGTSAPELVVGITAIRKKHPELLIGNVIGADILNVLFVIGASAVATPLDIIAPEGKIPEIFLILHLPAMLLILLLFRVFIFRASGTGAFERWMGWPLLAIYVIYTVLGFVLSADLPAAH